MADLTEASLTELLSEVRKPGLTPRPRQLVLSVESINHARSLALRDAEVERRVRVGFPDLADGLLWPVCATCGGRRRVPAPSPKVAKAWEVPCPECRKAGRL